MKVIQNALISNKRCCDVAFNYVKYNNSINNSRYVDLTTKNAFTSNYIYQSSKIIKIKRNWTVCVHNA